MTLRRITLIASFGIIAGLYVLAPYLPDWVTAWPRDLVLPVAKTITAAI